MKKVLLFYGLLIAALVIFLLARGTNFLNFGGESSSNATAKIGSKTYKLILAKTDEEKIKGLSGRDNLASDTGMLFVFDKKGKHAFWMKDMKFPIDIIFINDNKITDIAQNAPPQSEGQLPSSLPVYKPSEDINYVLELNAGEIKKNKSKKGDKVTLQGVK